MNSRKISGWARFSRRHGRAINLAKVGFIFGLFWLYAWKTLDPDFGWHLRAGKDILSNWIPSHDPYSYTASSFPWINHEWASDVLVYLLYQLGGFWLLTTVFAALWTAGVCLFRDKIRLLVLLLATLATLPYVGVRPIVWTVLGFAILLELANRNTKAAKRIIPFLFLVWANLHGGFIVGLAALGYIWISKREKQWLGILALSLLATCINPYGARLYVEIARTITDPAIHYQLTEWRYFYLQPTTWPFITMWGVGFWLYSRKKLSNWFGLAPLLLLASLSATRNMPLFVIASLRDIDRYGVKFRLPSKPNRASKIIIAAFTIVLLGVIGLCIKANLLPYTDREATYPQQAVKYLQEHGCSGNLFNDYNYGGYIIWKVPSVPVYIDGRMPTWHDDSGQTYISRYLEAIKHPALLRYEFIKHNVGCALLAVGRDDKAITTLQNQGWQTAVGPSNGAVLLVAPR